MGTVTATDDAVISCINGMRSLVSRGVREVEDFAYPWSDGGHVRRANELPSSPYFRSCTRGKKGPEEGEGIGVLESAPCLSANFQSA